MVMEGIVWMTDRCMNLKQPTTIEWTTDFHIAPLVWEVLPPPATHAHQDRRCVIITLLCLHKTGCKGTQASQLAPLTFSPLSSPLCSFSSPSVFHAYFSVLLFFFFKFVLSYLFILYAHLSLFSPSTKFLLPFVCFLLLSFLTLLFACIYYIS